MFDNDVKKFFLDTASKINIEISNIQMEQFVKYASLLQEWNKFMNLTAVCEDKDIVIKHFIDSLTIVKYIKKYNCKSFVDVGTGAGFPGIPLKIIMPELNVTLLDSLGKRVNFLQTVIDELGLKNIKAIHSRAEDSGRDKNLREKFDCASARAVASMNILLEYCMPFVKKGGHFIAMKGSSEEEAYENALKELCGELESEDMFVLPKSDFSRRVICIKKIKNLSTTYPRKAGIPKKNPL